MKCPRCKIENSLVPEIYEGVEIDRCHQCQGVWLDDGELVKIMQSEEESFSPELIQQAIAAAFTGIPEAETQSHETCPRCDAALKAVNYAYSSGVVIDRCPEQHGLWLDNQEIDKIQIHHEHWEKEKKQNAQTWHSWVSDIQEKHDLKYEQEASGGRLRHIFTSIGRRLFAG
tara:strand:+ start:6504 stop:7019 length:516 start_codon:yes stop_codon:yes gene_type:complete